MNTIHFVINILVLVVLIKIYYLIRPEKLRPGDIVIITNPHGREDEMNMITEVINIFTSGTVQVRGIGTTITLSRKWVHRINVNRGSSIKVPKKPEPGDQGNGAGFWSIPLEWFSYNAPYPDKESV